MNQKFPLIYLIYLLTFLYFLVFSFSWALLMITMASIALVFYRKYYSLIFILAGSSRQYKSFLFNLFYT